MSGTASEDERPRDAEGAHEVGRARERGGGGGRSCAVRELLWPMVVGRPGSSWRRARSLWDREEKKGGVAPVRLPQIR